MGDFIEDVLNIQLLTACIQKLFPFFNFRNTPIYTPRLKNEALKRVVFYFKKYALFRVISQF